MKRTRILSRLFAAVALVATAASARAQIVVHAPANPRLRIESGEVATLAFSVKHTGVDTITAAPVITLPAGWSTVMSPAATALASSQPEIWLVSVRSPSTGAAGSYV